MAKTTLATTFLGYARPYDETLAYMHERHRLIASKQCTSELLMLEHEAVITITRQHMERSVKTSAHAIQDDGIHLAIADRGGDATFHGPGQLVGYPLIDLDNDAWRLPDGNVDLEAYIRLLEETLLTAMHKLGFIGALLVPGFSGIWYRCNDTASINLKKLIAIGVGVKDRVSKHGFALNIDIDHQRYSKHITPCGLKDRGVITLKEIAVRENLVLPSWEVIMNTIDVQLRQALALHNSATLEMQQHSVMVNEIDLFT